MGRFMDQAVDQAGREFGSRFWRWFVAARMLRGAAPCLVVIGLALGALVGYRWWSPDWVAGLSALSAGLSWLGLALLGAAIAVIVFVVVLLLARSWWRWPMIRPMWMDSSRRVAAGAIAVIAAGAIIMIFA